MFRWSIRFVYRCAVASWPIYVLAAIWTGWWWFGDRPIKISRPPQPLDARLITCGLTGRTVLESAAGSESKYWRDLDTGAHIVEPREIVDCRAVLSGDEETLITERNGGPTQLFDRRTGRVRAELPSRANIQPSNVFEEWEWALSARVRHFAYPTADGAVVVVDVGAGRVVARFDDLKPPVSISADGRYLFAAEGPGGMVLRSLDDGRDIAKWVKNDSIFHAHVALDGKRVLLALTIGPEVLSTEPVSRHMLTPLEATPFVYLAGHDRFAVVEGAKGHRLYDLASWPPTQLVGQIAKVDVRFPNDLPVLATISADRQNMTFYSTATAEPVLEMRSPSVFAWPLASVDGHCAYVSDIGRTGINRLLYDGIGLNLGPQFRYHFHQIPSGQLMRTLPAMHVLHVSSADETTWILPEGSSMIDGVYEQWSLRPPKPPWWLWVVTAIGAMVQVLSVGWSFKRRHR